MQRRTADTVVGATIALVLVAGLIATWQSWQSAQRQTSGMMMDGMMTTSMTNTGPAPIWVFLGTVTIAAIVGIGYLVAREAMTGEPRGTGGQPRTEDLGSTRTTAGTDGTTVPAQGKQNVGLSPGDEQQQTTSPSPDGATADSTRPGDATAESTGSGGRPAILDVLPDDERRILEPVVESPGLTQIELRDRSDFSKSKVSQTVSDLEKRGLLSREKQGRTYRVYPAGELDDDS